MTGSVWDGTGRDPWLPARLDARLNVGTAEESIRAAFWAALAGWLTGTARRVLRGERPDLDVVWAQVPDWRDAVDKVVQGEIRDAMGSAYARTLGRGYSWDQRPFVTTYLAEVRNRLVRVPEEVYDLVAEEVAQAVNLGEGIPKIRDRVDMVLSTTKTERWPNRATVVARTETIGALNAGRSDAFRVVEEETDEPLEKVWLSTTDSRTRPTHRSADGQRVPVGSSFTVGGFSLSFPGDPSGPAQEIISCRCTLLLVEVGESTDMSNRQFLGA